MDLNVHKINLIGELLNYFEWFVKLKILAKNLQEVTV
jgi:hypothetical protein